MVAELAQLHGDKQVISNDPYPEEDGIGIGLTTGHPVHAKTILYLLYEVFDLPPPVMKTHYLTSFLLPIGGNHIVRE